MKRRELQFDNLNNYFDNYIEMLKERSEYFDGEIEKYMRDMSEEDQVKLIDVIHSYFEKGEQLIFESKRKYEKRMYK